MRNAPDHADIAPAENAASAWMRTGPRRAAAAPLDASREVDIAIIGAGFTGLSCALAAAENGREAAVIEARSVGYGGSGRNAGQWLVGWSGRTPQSIQKQYGKEVGDYLNRYNIDAVCSLQQSTAANAPASGVRRTGILTLARNAAQAKALCELRQQWRAAGANVEFLIKEELKAHLQSDRYCGALYCRDGGTIHPFAYASALADEAIKAGAALFEASPAKSIKPDGGKWIVKTPGGEIRADCVAICTNAYGGAVWPGLDRAFYRIKMAMIASDPLSSETLRRLPHRTPFADVGSIAIFGGMIDAQSRLVASVFAGFVRNGDPARLALGFDAQFRKTFPGVQTPAWTQSWMGDLCVTPDRTPKLLNLAPGVAAAIGYSGAGIALSGALGRTLFQYLTEPKSCRFPISQLSRAPMSSVIPFALTRIAAPASRMIQQL